MAKHSIDTLLCVHEAVEEVIEKYYGAMEPELEEYGKIESDSSVNYEGSHLANKMSTDEIDALLNCITELTRAKERLMNAKVEMHRSELYTHSREITDQSLMEERTVWCSQTRSHIKVILENKELLTWFLQQNFIRNFLTMQYQYHHDLKCLLKELVSILGDFGDKLGLLTVEKDKYQTQSKSAVGNISSVLSDMKRALREVSDLQSKTSKMTELD